MPHALHESTGAFARLRTDVQLLIDLINDYRRGEYRSVPGYVIRATSMLLLYVVNPFDLVRDYEPVIGEVDDFAILSVCVVLMEKELERYKAWKEIRSI